ncbi:MAG: ABC transporter permease subunit [Limnochordales bacterium]|nr:ABC transporter permease subunit [Limnochordales bacterium]
MSVTSQRLHAVRLIAGRELRSTLMGIGIYIVMAVSFLLSSYFINGYLYTIVHNGALAMPSPLMVPLFVAVFVGALYLGLLSSLAISRERDQGTLEVLFYGPVDSFSYVVGKFVEQMAVFGVFLLFDLVFFAIMALITNFGFNWQLIALLLISFFVAASVVAFGIFLSSLTRSSRASVILFVAIQVSFIAFFYLYQSLMKIPDKELSTTMIYVRQALDYMRRGIEWISPLDYLNRGAAAVASGGFTGFLIALIEAVIYGIILLAAAIFFFNRRGVRK